MNQGELFDTGPRRDRAPRPSRAKVKARKARKKASRRLTIDQCRAYVAAKRLNPGDFIPDDEQLDDLMREFDLWRKVAKVDLGHQFIYRSQAYACSEERLHEFLRMRGWGHRTPDHKPIRLRDGGPDRGQGHEPVPWEPGYNAWARAEYARIRATLGRDDELDDNT